MQDGRNWPTTPTLSYPGRAALGSSTLWRSESVVSARIMPLRLECFEQLPKHARRCVFWEVDPTALGRDDRFADPEFEKEAWLSMVMLEWGACGQIAIPVREHGDDQDPEHSEAPCVGYALYAPPGAVPRAGSFPTSPVSPDAVLLDVDGRRAWAARHPGPQPRRASGRGSDPTRSPRVGGVRADRRGRGVGRPSHRSAGRPLGGTAVRRLLVRPVHDRSGFPVGHRLHRCRAAPVLPAAAPRAGPGPGLEGRSGGCAGSAVAERAAGAGWNGGRPGGCYRLSRPACSTDNSCASNSANVKVPVGRSFLPRRYSLLTAARIPSAIESRVWVVTSIARSRGLVM